MAQQLTRAITIRRPHDEVAAFVTDPHRVLPVIPGFARFTFVGAGTGDGTGEGTGEGSEQWDVFLDVGTLHIGGRVVVRRPSVNRLEWSSARGAQHCFAMTVEPVGDHTRLTMVLEYSFPGLLMARATEVLGRGIAARHLEAGLEELRHLLEHGEAVEPA